MSRAVWDELNSRPLTPPPAWARTVPETNELQPLPRIGATRRLRGEPPCPVCNNRSAWHCECEVDHD